MQKSARVLAGIAALALTGSAHLAHASVDAAITGVVDDALLHPLKGATVILHDSAGNTVAKSTTGADGKFSFPGISFGDYTVEASAPGLIGDHQHLQINSSQVIAVELTLVAGEEIINITDDWAVPPPPPVTGSVATVTRQTLNESPGGDDRPITDVIATQPGFVADALGNVYARGNHANIQYQVDGIPVPDSVGSLFAASIPTRLINGLEIYTGGMPAEFGDRLGAVVNLTTRSASDHPDGNVQVRYGSFNTVEPGATYAAKLSDTVGVFGGGSFQYSERMLDPPSVYPILHDDGYSGRAFARIDWQQCDCNRYELFATYAHNKFDIPLDPSIQPLTSPTEVRPPDQYGNASPPYIPHDTNATETEDEVFVAAAMTHKLDNGQILVAPLYKLSRGVLFSDPEHALGPLSDPGTTASNVTRLAETGGGVATISLQEGSHLFKAGVQIDFLHGKTNYESFARAEDGGIDPSMTQAGVDHTDALTSGAYAQDHVTLGKLALDYGLRVDELHVILQDGTTNDSAGVSPRLGGSYSFTKDTVLHAFAGINWQPPEPLDAANAARALGVVPANEQVVYDLKPETDLYSELGISSRLIHELRGGLTAWGRYAYNQLDDTAIGSTSLLSNYNFRRGRATGLEASLDLRIGPWLSAFANGSLGLAEGQGISSAKYLFTAAELADTSWQTLDHAQTWTANSGVTVRDGRFAITGMLQYGSGLRTGSDNDQHVPGHVVENVSAQYTFVPHAYPIKVAIDVINIANEYYAYRIANGFVGSSYGQPRSVFMTLSLPLAAEPHHPGE